MPAVVNRWLVVVPVVVVPSSKFHRAEVMAPVDEPALKETLSGAVPVSGAAAIAALSAVLSVGAVGSVVGSAVIVKVNGAECGLSVPSLKVAVRVKLVVSDVSVTRQSMEVAAGSVLWQAKTPSW